MKRWITRIAKGLGLSLAALLALILLALLALQIGAVRDPLVRRVLASVNEGLEGRVALGHVRGSLLTGARVSDVTIFDSRDNLAAFIPEVALSYKPGALLRGQLIIEEVQVSEPQLVVRSYPDQRLNWTLLSAPSDAPGEPLGIAIYVDRVRIQQGFIAYLDEASEAPDNASLQALRSRSVQALNQARDTPSQLSTIWRRSWQSAHPDADGIPGAPLSAALDELHAELTTSLYREDILADLKHLEFQAHLDWLADAQHLSLGESHLRLSGNLIHAEIGQLRAGELFDVNALQATLTLPPASEASSTDDTAPSPPLEQAFAHLDTLRVPATTLDRFSAQPLGLSGPITLSARAAGGKQLEALLTLNLPGVEAPLELSAQLADYSSETPRYLATLSTPTLTTSAVAPGLELPGLTTRLRAQVMGLGFDPDTMHTGIRARADELRYDATYEAELLYVAGDLSAGELRAHRLAALSPYLDLFASARLNPEGRLQAALRTTADNVQARRASELTGEAPVTADVSLDLDGRFDPAIDELTEAARALSLDARWRFEGFDAFDVAINNSRGTLVADLKRAGESSHRYHATYTLDARAAGVALGPHRLGSLRAQDQGRIELALPLNDPLASLTDLENDLRVNLTNLRTQGNRVERANLRLASQKRPEAPRSLQTRLVVDAQGIHNPGASVERFNTDLRATARLGQGDDPFETLRAFTLRGESTASRLRAPQSDAAITTARLHLDLQGRLDAPRGDVTLELDKLTLGTNTFDSAALQLHMASGDQVRAEAQLSRDAERHYGLGATLTHARRYARLALTELHLGSDRARWESPPESRITWDGRTLGLESFQLDDTHASGSLRADGTWTPGASQALELAMLNIAPGQIASDFHLDDLPRIDGQIDLLFSMAGTSSAPTFNLTTELSSITYEEEGPFGLTLAAGYERGSLTLPQTRVFAYGQPVLELSARLPVNLDLKGNTSVDWNEDFLVDLALAPLRLRDFHQALPQLNDYGVEGDLNGRFRWTGSLSEPDFSLALNAQGLQFAGEVGGDYLSIRSLDLASQTTYSPPRGSRGGLDTRINLDWRSQRLALLEANAALPLAQWLRSATGVSDEALSWQDAFLTLPVRLLLDIPDINLRSIPLQLLRDADASGEGSIKLDLAGTLGRPSGRVDVALKELGWQNFRDMFVDLNARLGDGRLNVERFRFEWDADEILVADGSLPLPIESLVAGETVDDIPLNFRAQLRELPLSKLSTFNYEFSKVTGDIAAYLTLDGSLRAPRLNARAGLFETRLGDGSTGTLSLEVSGADNAIEVDARLCRQYEDVLTLAASLPVNMDTIGLATGAPWQAPGELRVDLESDPLQLDKVLPLQLLTDLIKDPQGTFEADLKVRGDWETPSIDGQLQLRQAALTLVDMGRRFVDINADIELDDDQLRINTFELHDGPGQASLTGAIAHERFVPDELNLDLNADGFNVEGLAVDFPVYVTGVVGARGNLQGSPGNVNLRISGLEVQLTDTQDTGLHATELNSDIVVLDRSGRRRASSDAAEASELATRDLSAPSALNLRVNIRVDRDAWVRHPIGNVNLQADIVALLSGTNVSLSGSAEALRGDLEFLGRRFNVQPSEVAFTGASPPNPRLQLEATYELDRAITQSLGPPSDGDPRIIFRISGSADNPRLVLQSDPAMTDTEILFVLMTGRPPSRGEVGRDEGVANQALGAVSGLFFGLLQDQLSGTVPVDVLRLEPGEGGLQGGRLEFGKYITNDIFLSYRIQLGGDEDEATNIVRVEYHFLPRWMVELTYTDQNEGGANIYWDVY
ncbi:translocation/assembly module TamB domain-containing protein [Lujinxingia litoralis]|nr:translocation/assembly module TamB domain-containing protein [Lujinxingia litoralis]